MPNDKDIKVTRTDWPTNMDEFIKKLWGKKQELEMQGNEDYFRKMQMGDWEIKRPGEK